MLEAEFVSTCLRWIVSLKFTVCDILITHRQYRSYLSGATVEADSDIVCQPGVLWMDINATLEEKGSLF